MQAQENHVVALSKMRVFLATVVVILVAALKGLRGMDVQGYCVVVAIPLETPDNAIPIQVNVFELLHVRLCVPMARI